LFAKMPFIIKEDEYFNHNKINKTFCTLSCLFMLQVKV
jgi:hypothetical protein